MKGLGHRLVSPETGAALVADGPHALSDGETRWPVVDAIPFLRAGRDDLRATALAALDRGDVGAARRALLADRDDHARGPGPAPEALAALSEGRVATLREAMAALDYGPVADYFAHRWSAPTFVSALGLLAEHWPEGLALVEVACGIGQILREAAATGAPVAGSDVVFSKLWLARRYVVGEGVPLVCADAEKGLGLALDAPACVLCHDALYFLHDKAAALAGMRRLAGEGGAVLIGHAHNAHADHRGVAGWPLAPAEWVALMPEATLYDDDELGRAWVEGRRATAAVPDGLHGAEALCLAEGPRNLAPRPVGIPTGAGHARAYRLNPLLETTSEGGLAPVWPSAAMADEYGAEAGYLHQAVGPSAAAVAAGAAGRPGGETLRLVRERVLIDLPEAW